MSYEEGEESSSLVEEERRDLRERTKEFALRMIRMFGGLPKTTEAQVVGKQVLRSGTSVGANYREAFRARSKAGFVSKCGDALKEAEETTYWLELLIESQLVPEHRLSALYQEADEITAIFASIVKSARSKAS